MEAKRFEVEVVHQQRTRYLVEAADPEEAERIALEKWQQEDEEGLLDDECCEEVVSVAASEAQDPESAAREQEAVYRMLRDRELVIETLARDRFNPAIHDAVSAEDVARHLKWSVPDANGDPVPDIARAAHVLDALCHEQRVICFDRPRVRLGERGEIRLYCTPHHLERLAALLAGVGAAPAASEDAERPTTGDAEPQEAVVRGA